MISSASQYLALAFLAFQMLIAACNHPGKKPEPRAAQITYDHEHCIKKVIAQDDSLGALRNHACETISLASTIQHYADALEKIDFSDCPTNFTMAFARHRKAWRQMIPLTEKYPDLRGEMHDLFDLLEQGEEADGFKPLLKNIWDTWAEVEAAMQE